MNSNKRNKLPRKYADIDSFPKDFLKARIDQFYDFMREAVCADEIRRKNMEQTAQAVFCAGWCDGFRDGRDGASGIINAAGLMRDQVKTMADMLLQGDQPSDVALGRGWIALVAAFDKAMETATPPKAGTS